MVRLAMIAFGAAALGLGACGASASGPNVRGVLDRSGAGSPRCFRGEPCDPSPVGVFVVFSREGHEPVRVKVQPDGSFAVRLAPGAYRISLAPPPLAAHVVPETVRAPAGGVARLTLEIVS